MTHSDTGKVYVLADKCQFFFLVYMENIAAYSKSDMGMFGLSQGVLSLKKKKVGNKKELTFGSVLGNEHFT